MWPVAPMTMTRMGVGPRVLSQLVGIGFLWPRRSEPRGFRRWCWWGRRPIDRHSTEEHENTQEQRPCPVIQRPLEGRAFLCHPRNSVDDERSETRDQTTSHSRISKWPDDPHDRAGNQSGHEIHRDSSPQRRAELLEWSVSLHQIQREYIQRKRRRHDRALGGSTAGALERSADELKARVLNHPGR